ncbi:unnamed protein product [Fraxinus pennsylvanica]|uniref:Uncharacterized protein n=1 Tax=Fraxinus pennsylvanica TaxID=56036 RepID=A0AAD1YS60_9LAMI|nr:unnamed protein product [Fraxinus pennsylvanica]
MMTKQFDALSLHNLTVDYIRKAPPIEPDNLEHHHVYGGAVEDRGAELSNKLIKATKKRDEAILEASKLKYSMAELEKKLNGLEIYCHSLKSGLEVCSSTSKISVSFS